MGESTEAGGDTSNKFSGLAGNVVQARDVHGGVHFHQHPDVSLPVPRQLPADPAHFVNRAAELAELDRRLGQRSGVMISTVAGMAGAGKTSLAVHWAHRMQQRFPDGQLYVNLRGYESGPPISAEQALDGFLRVLGVPPDRIPTELEAQAGLYRSLLYGRRMLIVLDNARSVGQVRPLLPGSPGCHVVVTSRSRLSGLVTDQGAQRIVLEMLSPKEAVELLRLLIGADRVDAEHGAADEMARRCGYLPLALRVAGERAAASRHLTLADLNEELDAEYGRLDALATDEDETRMVRAVFSWSYRALSPEAARLFRLLGSHPGLAITTPAAAALAGVPVAKARRLLDVLAGAHLIEQTAREVFQFHDLLRDYAVERLHADEPEDERSSALVRLLSWYIATADAADRALLPHRNRLLSDPPEEADGRQPFPDGEEASRWLEAERENVLACVHRAHDLGHDVRAVKLTSIIIGFLELRDQWSEWISLQRVGIEAARAAGDRSAEAQFQVQLGDVSQKVDQFDEAKECYRQALAISRQLGERRSEGYCQDGLGLVHRRLGLLDDAAGYFEEALAIFREAEEGRGIDAALINLAITHQKIGNPEEAIRSAQEIAERGMQASDYWLRSAVPAVLGSGYKELGRLEESINFLERSLAVCRKSGTPSIEADVLALHGEVAYELGQVAEARESWQRALELFDSLGRSGATYFQSSQKTNKNQGSGNEILLGLAA